MNKTVHAGKPYAGVALTATPRSVPQLDNKRIKIETKLAAVLFAGTFLSLGIRPVLGDTVESGGLTWSYEVTDGTSVTLTGVSDKTSVFDAANFPWSFTKDGTEYTVTAIGERAFEDWVNLTGKLSIPGTVKTVGNRAFWTSTSNSRFAPLELAEGIETFGEYAFRGCLNANNGVDSVVIVPASATTIGQGFLQWAGIYVKSVWFKGRPTVASGEQPYTSIGINTLIYASGSHLRWLLFGKNTKPAGYGTMFYSSMHDCIVFAPAGVGWENVTFGGTGNTVLFYGAGRELDLTIDETAGRITATPTTANALSNVLASVSSFKTDFGLDTVISVTNAIPGTTTIPESAMSHILYDLHSWVKFAVETQAQLESLLAAIEPGSPVIIDPSGARENLRVPTGGRILVELGEGDVVKSRIPKGTAIVFR